MFLSNQEVTEEIKKDKKKKKFLQTNDNKNTTTQNLSVQFSQFSRSVMSNCDPINCGTPGFPVLRLPECAQTHVH